MDVIRQILDNKKKQKFQNPPQKEKESKEKGKSEASFAQKNDKAKEDGEDRACIFYDKESFLLLKCPDKGTLPKSEQARQHFWR